MIDQAQFYATVRFQAKSTPGFVGPGMSSARLTKGEVLVTLEKLIYTVRSGF